MARVNKDGFRNTSGLRQVRRLLAGAAVALIACQTPLFAQENQALLRHSTTDTIVAPLSDVLRGEGVPAALDRLEVGPRRRVAAGEAIAQRSAPSSPRGGWAARHPVLLGTLIGAGVGFGLASQRVPRQLVQCGYRRARGRRIRSLRRSRRLRDPEGPAAAAGGSGYEDRPCDGRRWSGCRRLPGVLRRGGMWGSFVVTDPQGSEVLGVLRGSG